MIVMLTLPNGAYHKRPIERTMGQEELTELGQWISRCLGIPEGWSYDFWKWSLLNAVQILWKEGRVSSPDFSLTLLAADGHPYTVGATSLLHGYPAGWPTCPGCSRPVLDGHMTCGDQACRPSADRP